MTRSLVVWHNDRRIGQLHEDSDLWRFEYDPGWSLDAAGFDLSPALPRAQLRHEDGGTVRPVQWYFDNLLPEERMREAISAEARIPGEDAFALLEYLGAESAGSLTLLPPQQPPPQNAGLRPLPDAELRRRIERLPRATLCADAPKRMSIAGAQHKLPVVLQGQQLFEPIGATPSTHILKPDHPSEDYPASAVNEYVTMRLAHAFGLPVPAVHLRYVPQPVYIIERFDRVQAAGSVQRRHIIDTCQLLNKARTFKFTGQSLQTLAEVAGLTRNRVATRLALFRWLLFNVALGNDDSHLKNLSFLVSAQGIELAPHYDLLSTCAYQTRAFADGQERWPAALLPYPLPGARTYAEINADAVMQAAAVLHVGRGFATRQLRQLTQIPGLLQQRAEAVDGIRARTPEAAVHAAGESRLLRVIEHVIVRDMLAALRPAA